MVPSPNREATTSCCAKMASTAGSMPSRRSRIAVARSARRCIRRLRKPVWYPLYNLILALLLGIALPFLPLLLFFGPRYRAGLGQRCGFYPKAIRQVLTATRPLWIHAASVGEVRSTEPLVSELKARAPGRKLLLSTFSATGNRIAREIPGVD